MHQVTRVACQWYLFDADICTGVKLLNTSIEDPSHHMDPGVIGQLYNLSAQLRTLSWFFNTLYETSQKLLEDKGETNTQQGKVLLLEEYASLEICPIYCIIPFCRANGSSWQNAWSCFSCKGVD